MPQTKRFLSAFTPAWTSRTLRVVFTAVLVALVLSAVVAVNKTAFAGLLATLMTFYPAPLPPHPRRRTNTPEPKTITASKAVRAQSAPPTEPLPRRAQPAESQESPPPFEAPSRSPSTPREPKPLPPVIFSDTTSSGANNCLFHAAINARGVRRANAQALRDACDAVLIKEGFPTIPKHHPAGEQYLQALSFIFRQRIFVFKNDTLVSEVCHSDVYESGEADENEPLDLEHMGSALGGHWEHYARK